MSNNIYDAGSQKTTEAIIDEATEWLLRMQDAEVNDADKQDFTKWLKRSPLHIREYLRAEATWVSLESVDPDRQMEIDTSFTAASNVVDFSHKKEIGQSRSDKPMHWLKQFAMVAGIAAVGLSVWIYLQPEKQIYQTGLGEQRRVVLDDGSVVELNTRTEIEVVLGAGSRQVRLLAGEALFKVHANSQHPFTVISEQAQIDVLGTEFNVYQQAEQATVTVLDGLVAVRNAQMANQKPVQLAAGYEISIHVNSDSLMPVNANTERALAWRDQRLIFDNSTLANAVEEFNRYNRKQLIILDPILKAQEINGVFDASRPEALMRFLVQSGSARVVKETSDRIVLESVL